MARQRRQRPQAPRIIVSEESFSRERCCARKRSGSRKANRWIVLGTGISAGFVVLAILFVTRSPAGSSPDPLHAAEAQPEETEDQRNPSRSVKPARLKRKKASERPSDETAEQRRADEEQSEQTTDASNKGDAPLLELMEKGVVFRSADGSGQTALIEGPSSVTDSDLPLLARIRDLTEVVVRHPAISDQGIEHLAASLSLKRLSLHGSQFQGTSLVALAARSSIEFLDVSGTSVGDRQIVALASRRELRELNVADTLVTQAGRSALKLALPDLRILPEIDSTTAISTEPAPQSAPVTSAGSSREADSRMKVPATADQEVARTQLRDTFIRQFAAATTASRRRALAQTLCEAAADYPPASLQHYIHLDESIRMSLRAGDWQQALKVIDQFCVNYAVEPGVRRAEAIEKSVEYVSAAKAKDLAVFAFGQSEQAADAGDYPAALRLASSADAAARKSRDRELIRKSQKRTQEIHAAHSAWQAAEHARAVLKHSPDDERARYVLGRFLCLYRNDWPKGLRELAAGSQPEWREAATSELQNPEAASDQVMLAKRWLTLVEAAGSVARRAGREHALVWLRRAVVHLTGQERSETEALIAETEASLDSDEANNSGESSTESTAKASSKKKSSKPDRSSPGEIIMTPITGGEGGEPFKFVAPTDSVLVGVRIGNTNPIKFIQPIYLEEGSLKYGPILGEETGRTVEVIARKGYCLAGVVLNTGDYVKGMSITFAEQKPANRLKPRWYDSPPVGSMLDGKVTRIGRPEVRVIGIHGRARFLVDGIGLVGHKR